MAKKIKIKLPLTDDDIKKLRAGDIVLLSGQIYTARDAAHKRLFSLLINKEPLPVNLKAETIYYVGPTPGNKDLPVGSAGPTTSDRMDGFTPALLDYGLKGIIGKGPRSAEVKESLQKNKAIYFAAVGGAGALLAKKIKAAEIVAYEDLGTEAIRRLTIEGFPVIVVNDIYGNDVYLQRDQEIDNK